ncbi:hypothetical protein GAPWKB11_0206 [Gilliamella apicola]|nr:hypothetical protein GAPWKB11_0206 [Gilliamella apicola]
MFVALYSGALLCCSACIFIKPIRTTTILLSMLLTVIGMGDND